MHLERLSQRGSSIVGELLLAAADGPFFPDWEFQTLFGLSRDEVHRIGCDWPVPIAPAEDVVTAVNNAMNMLLGYPHRKHDVWHEWISVDQEVVAELLSSLRGRRDESHFDRIM